MGIEMKFSRNSLIEEKFRTLAQSVAVKCDAANMQLKDPLTDPEEVLERLIIYFEQLDLIYNVFAAIYDENLRILTNRYPNLTLSRTEALDPIRDVTVRERLLNEENGMLNNCKFTVIFDNGKTTHQTASLYFHKIHFSKDFVITVIAIPYDKGLAPLDTWKIFILVFITIVVLFHIVYINRKLFSLNNELITHKEFLEEEVLKRIAAKNVENAQGENGV